jgi:hypothetical protein
MVERYRSAIIPAPEPTPAPKPKPALFVCLPKQILQHPPIAHRNRPAKGLLSVFECAVAAGIVSHARREFERMRRRRSLKAGRQAVSDRDKVGATVAAVKRFDDDISYDFKDAMSDAYWRSYANSRAPDVITISVSKSALLKAAAKQSQGGKNYARLETALRRLRRPVQAGREMPSLLVAVERLTEVKLRLAVSGKWLPMRQFGRAPLPLPTKGNCANALALFLFVCGSDQRVRSATNSIDLEKLCLRLGIRYRWPAEACAALRDALAVVNEHLAGLNRDGALDAAKPTLAAWFELFVLDGRERVRFVAHYGATDKPKTAEGAKASVHDDNDEIGDAEADRTVDRQWEAEWDRKKAERDRRCKAALEGRADPEEDLQTFLARKLGR